MTFTVNCDIAELFDTALNQDLVVAAAEAALLAEGLDGQAIEVSVVITDDAEVQELNRTYRGKDSTTDVLSFSAEESGDDDNFVVPEEYLAEHPARYLGDIIVSYPQAERQAADFNNTPQRETQELVIHGVFHLLGYDHEEEADREVMRAKEEEAANILNSKSGSQTTL